MKHVATLFAFFVVSYLFGVLGGITLAAILYWGGFFSSDSSKEES